MGRPVAAANRHSHMYWHRTSEFGTVPILRVRFRSAGWITAARGAVIPKVRVDTTLWPVAKTIKNDLTTPRSGGKSGSRINGSTPRRGPRSTSSD